MVLFLSDFYTLRAKLTAIAMVYKEHRRRLSERCENVPAEGFDDLLDFAVMLLEFDPVYLPARANDGSSYRQLLLQLPENISDKGKFQFLIGCDLMRSNDDARLIEGSQRLRLCWRQGQQIAGGFEVATLKYYIYERGNAQRGVELHAWIYA